MKKVFTEFGIARFLWNSIFITVVSTILTLAVACLAAFSYKAYEYRMKETFSKMVLFVYMFPQILIIIPIYLMMSKMGLINTYKGLILCYIAFELPICIWTMPVSYTHLQAGYQAGWRSCAGCWRRTG